MKFIKLSSATLVETLVAMTIILGIFALAVIIFVNTNGVSTSTKKIRADELLSQFADETERERSYFDDLKESDMFTLKKLISEEKPGSQIVSVIFYAYDGNNKLIAEQHRLFRK